MPRDSASLPPDPDPSQPRAQKRSQTWAMDMIRRHMPTREEMASNRYLAPIAHRFLSPELWRFTRRSVPRGVALGLFAGFIIPVGQIFLAAFMALPSRANVPVAALTTFVTNPFTLPFWLVVANRVGTVTLQIDGSTTGIATGSMETELWGWFVEFFQQAGVTVVGFAMLAVVSATLGYVIAGWVWRVMVARKRAKRLRLMEDRLDQRLGSQ